MLRGGSVVDPDDQVGLAAFTAQLLTRGTRTHSADDIAEAIDFLGGTLDASASSDWISVSLGVLEPDLAEGLALLADVVMYPTFPDSEVELVRTRALSGLEASLAQPGVLAGRAFTRAVYGGPPLREAGDSGDVRGRSTGPRSRSSTPPGSVRETRSSWWQDR